MIKSFAHKSNATSKLLFKSFPLFRKHNQLSIVRKMSYALSPSEFRSFKVQSVSVINHNTKRIRFQFPTENSQSGLTVASCLVTKAQINNEDVIRPYTPVTLNNTKGYMDLIVKSYPQGLMSSHICSLTEGDSLLMKGPFPKIKINPAYNSKPEISMVAGGSGITPMYQVIQELLGDDKDQTKLNLIYCNVNEDDILLRNELDSFAKQFPDRFSVHYVLNNPPAQGWEGYVGYFSEEIALKHCPKPGTDGGQVFVCGPPPMMEAISGDKMPDKSQGELKGLLKKMGYKESEVYKF